MLVDKDYDLNIFHSEELNEATGNWEYTDQWYMDIYEHLGGNQEHVSGPYRLTAEERDAFDLGNHEKWDDDSWYGLEGFLKDFKGNISPTLLEIFGTLPEQTLVGNN